MPPFAIHAVYPTARIDVLSRGPPLHTSPPSPPRPPWWCNCFRPDARLSNQRPKSFDPRTLAAGPLSWWNKLLAWCDEHSGFMAGIGAIAAIFAVIAPFYISHLEHQRTMR